METPCPHSFVYFIFLSSNPGYFLFGVGELDWAAQSTDNKRENMVVNGAERYDAVAWSAMFSGLKKNVLIDPDVSTKL